MEWREGQDASSTLGSDEEGDDDMDKATDTRLYFQAQPNTASKFGPHTQTDRGTCLDVGL